MDFSSLFSLFQGAGSSGVPDDELLKNLMGGAGALGAWVAPRHRICRALERLSTAYIILPGFWRKTSMLRLPPL
jgi:hypothetical protein